VNAAGREIGKPGNAIASGIGVKVIGLLPENSSGRKQIEYVLVVMPRSANTWPVGGVVSSG
jgi:hypothetical protein